jgi:hypothetical protein
MTTTLTALEYGQHHYYDIHNTIKVESDVLLYELEYFRVPCVDRPDLSINVKEFIPSGMCFKPQLTLKYQNQFYTMSYSEQFGSLGAEFEIDFLADLIKVHI